MSKVLEEITQALKNKSAIPIHAMGRACYEGDLEAVEMLVKHGVDVNAHNGMPLETAATLNNINVLSYLIEQGANVNNGMALLCAAKNGQLEAVELLLKNGVTAHGNALTIAVSKGHIEIAKGECEIAL